MEMPQIVYGTAWKKEQTSDLVVKAISAGFRGIDTAGQPKHYNEAGVGEALRRVASQGIAREEIFLQTKYTPIGGHDPLRVPYDPGAPLSAQVAQSFASSLKNLGTDYVDSLVLHSPLPRWSQLEEVWSAMQALYERGVAKRIGISNCYDLEVMSNLFEYAKTKPSVLQNRFYADTGHDIELRLWCKDHGVRYQSFWTLTGNPHILGSSEVREIAKNHARTEAQVFYRFVNQLGITPLSGTTSEIHMKEDLSIFEFSLSEQELEAIQSLLG